MIAPESIAGVVCDTAAVVAVVDELGGANRAGYALYDRARQRGLTLAVPYIVAAKAVLHLPPSGAGLLGALLFPELYRAPGDPLRATGPRGVWWVERRRPERLPGYPAMLGQCGDPVVAYVAAYAVATGWPVATDDPSTYARLLGRDDALLMPQLPGSREG
ncbi:MAG TPA: hypothetical protein VFM55_21350 [Micromonosporaceae bacterium]|nr:hypothetical protein [Micromonosporaceae bacterium]